MAAAVILIAGAAQPGAAGERQPACPAAHNGDLRELAGRAVGSGCALASRAGELAGAKITVGLAGPVAGRPV